MSVKIKKIHYREIKDEEKYFLMSHKIKFFLSFFELSIVAVYILTRWKVHVDEETLLRSRKFCLYTINKHSLSLSSVYWSPSVNEQASRVSEWVDINFRAVSYVNFSHPAKFSFFCDECPHFFPAAIRLTSSSFFHMLHSCTVSNKS